MSGRTFSDEEYAGAYVRIPIGFADRLVVAAQNHMARQSRYIDPEADPITVVGQWLEQLERARTMPTPHAEPGDLLVKLARGEFWTFTVHGWRELAPIELQTVADPFPPGAPREYQDGDPMMQPEPGVAPRFWGRSVVEDELDKARDARRGYENVQAAADPLSPAVRGAFDELQAHAEVLEHVAEALAGGDDGGNNSPSFESIAQARTFARALAYAREVIWKHANLHQGT